MSLQHCTFTVCWHVYRNNCHCRSYRLFCIKEHVHWLISFQQIALEYRNVRTTRVLKAIFMHVTVKHTWCIYLENFVLHFVYSALLGSVFRSSVCRLDSKSVAWPMHCSKTLSAKGHYFVFGNLFPKITLSLSYILFKSNSTISIRGLQIRRER